MRGSQEVDDAARYVELARAGWKDPAVDTFELLSEVVAAAHMDREFFAEEAREAKEEAEERIAELRAELAIEGQDVSTLLEALKVAIARERNEALIMHEQLFADRIAQRDARTATHHAKIAAQGDEIALLRAELRTLKNAIAVAEPAPPDDSSPAPKRNTRSKI